MISRAKNYVVLLLLSALTLAALISCGKSSEIPPAKEMPSPEYRAQVINPNYSGGISVNGISLLWGSDGSIQRSEDDGKTWSLSETQTSAQLNRIAAEDDGKIFIAVGNYGNILRSDDQGRSWKNVHVDANTHLKALLYVSKSETWLSVGTAGTLLTSGDHGLSWKKLPLAPGLSMLDLESLYLVPTKGTPDKNATNSGRILFGGTKGLLGISDDGGASWQVSQLDLDTPLSNFFAFDNLLLATSAYGKFLVSKDGSESWQLIETDGQAFFHDAAYDPVHKTIVLVSHNGKILRSDDVGVSWQLAEAPYHGVLNYLSTVFFDAEDKLLRAFGHHGTHLTSSDGGLNWQSQAVTPAITFDDVLLNNSEASYIGYGRGGFIARTTDKGKTWSARLMQTDIYWREVLITAKGNWLAAGELGFILRSQDQGSSWQLIDVAYTDPITPPTYRSLIIEPQSKAIIAAGPTGTIMRSLDEGLSWSTVHYTPFAQAEAFTDILIEPRRKHLVAVEADGHHYVSFDQGASWQSYPLQSERKFWHGSVLSNDERSVLLITGQGGVVARSKDGGLGWSLINSGTGADLFGSYADDTHQQFFVMGDDGTLLRSTDDGESWEKLTTNTHSDLRRMIADPVSGALLAFGGDGVILRSADAGKSWTSVTSPTQQELRNAVIDPDTRAILITGKDGKLIRSGDGGVSWKILDTHTNTHFRGIAVDPNTGAILLAGERIVQLHQ